MKVLQRQAGRPCAVSRVSSVLPATAAPTIGRVPRTLEHSVASCWSVVRHATAPACAIGPRTLSRRPEARCKVASQDKEPVSAVKKAPHSSYVASSALTQVIGGVRAHESSLSSAIVLEDHKDGSKVLVTASMDKTIAAWRLVPNEDDEGEPRSRSSGGGSEPPQQAKVPPSLYCEVQKIPAPGGPIFSMARSRPLFEQAVPKPTPDGKTPVGTIFCGNAAKDVLLWQPFMPSFTQGFALGGHTGWVRSVSSHDRFLFSCGCNYLRMWDCTYASPKEIGKVKLFTGDILCVKAGGGFVYTGGADGSLRCYSIDKAKGTMTEVAALEKAHAGRVVALLRHNGYLYSCGCDGSIRMWVQGTMQPVGEVLNAHGKDVKVHCMAVAGNGVLYTGGDDQLIRAWDPSCLEPMPDFEPLKAHDSAVRLLVTGKTEILLSGDAEGYINFFCVEHSPHHVLATARDSPPVPEPAPPAPGAPLPGAVQAAAPRDDTVEVCPLTSTDGNQPAATADAPAASPGGSPLAPPAAGATSPAELRAAASALVAGPVSGFGAAAAAASQAQAQVPEAPSDSALSSSDLLPSEVPSTPLTAGQFSAEISPVASATDSVHSAASSGDGLASSSNGSSSNGSNGSSGQRPAAPSSASWSDVAVAASWSEEAAAVAADGASEAAIRAAAAAPAAAAALSVTAAFAASASAIASHDFDDSASSAAARLLQEAVGEEGAPQGGAEAAAAAAGPGAPDAGKTELNAASAIAASAYREMWMLPSSSPGGNAWADEAGTSSSSDDDRRSVMMADG